MADYNASNACTINTTTRAISVPTATQSFGVRGDNGITQIWFTMTNIFADLEDVAIRVNYKNASNENYSYLVTDASTSGNDIHFSWTLDRSVTKRDGTVTFNINARTVDSDGNVTSDWNSATATGTIAEGLTVMDAVITRQEYDAVTQLFTHVTNNAGSGEGGSGVSSSDVSSAISTALTSYTNTSGMNSAISTALTSYTNTSGMNTAIDNALDEALDNVVTTSRINWVNPDTLTSGMLTDSTQNYAISSHATYKVTDYIPITAGEPVTISPYCRSYTLYNANQEPTSYMFRSSSGGVATFTPAASGYLRVCMFTASDNLMVVKSSTAPEEFVPYSYTAIAEGIQFSESQKTFINNAGSNLLAGKKYVACGDSFTAGHFGDLTDTTFTEGLYAGQLKTYPFYIGTRNNMVVINEAVSGSTITRLSESETACFTVSRLAAIPTDADYITLKFGINDSNAPATIGTIDDDTDATFYGAWNITFRYLLTNCPYAKIGVIVSNGMPAEDSAYISAVKNAAAKWGIPYLDEAEDHNVPLLQRTNRESTVCAEAVNLRNAAFRVSASDTHPNPAAHEYESTFVENFLRSL